MTTSTIIKDFTKVRRARGEADIDVSAADYTAGFIELLSIAAPPGESLRKVEIVFDLAKATTGHAAVNSTETLQLALQVAADGTNFRTLQSEAPAALSGTASAGRALRFEIEHVDDVGIKVGAKLSAETGGDAEIPFEVIYHGREAVITPVAAA